ncbi:SDR family oxidoreductase [Ochrobactrum sp. CM-21-5]|nr:SDR family oxidoreductase [Ochrobactrum sp. CM-21-5]MBC2887120.1 SDR family oxidoreductase [Ochrobactrum sp. CM-21-5]
MSTVAERHAGKVVIVTGAGGGIGAAVCAKFAAESATVYALDRKTFENVGQYEQRVVDVTDTSEFTSVIQEIARSHGRIDVLVNNAGFLERQAALDITPADWQKSIDVNLTASFFGSQATARIMKDRGGGSIINLSSYAGLKGRPNCAHYASAKAAIAHLTVCLAVEWGPLNIRVNAIAPGYIETPMSAWMHGDPEQKAIYVEKTPLRRMGTPSEIADAVSYLASGEASYVTGQVMRVDGGITQS